ncbi:MAG: D-lyxose/D-mannose family sugar isomerase [Lentisphaerota bacterium]
MRRSEVNTTINNAVDFFSFMKFKLPPFAFYSIKDWRKNIKETKEIFDLNLGWDITDFGLGDFSKTGLLLFTLRNGDIKNRHYSKPYAEKIMMVREKQITPMHFHWHKMEDIINRGGGNLIIELFNSDKDNSLVNSDITVSIDGHRKTLKAGSKVKIEPGESICLTQGLYHRFYGEEGKGNVLVGEVSMINDDSSDNCFLEAVGRFPKIEEDQPPIYFLASDYKIKLQNLSF